MITNKSNAVIAAMANGFVYGWFVNNWQNAYRRISEARTKSPHAVTLPATLNMVFTWFIVFLVGYSIAEPLSDTN